MNTGYLVLLGLSSLALLMSSLGRFNAEAQPETKPPLQKSPISLPANVLLPATLAITKKWNQLPVVTASINSSLVESVVFDTGLNANVVVPDSATRLTLSPLTSKAHLNVLNLECDAAESQIQHVRAKSLDLQNVPVALANLPALLSQHPQPDAPAVWFGTPFLSAFQVTYDPGTIQGSGTLMLEKSQSPFPRNRETTVAPLVMRDGRPFVRVTIPGAKPFLALVDTGSPGTLIPGEVVEKLKIKPIKTDLTLGKQAKAAQVEVPKLTIGKAEWKDARIVYITSDASKEFDKSFAVLGMDFLNRFKVSLNFSRLQIAFTPPAKAGEASGENSGASKKPE